jgi:hypothetical protein
MTKKDKRQKMLIFFSFVKKKTINAQNTELGQLVGRPVHQMALKHTNI